MRDLQDPRLMGLKAVLFLGIGALSCALILAETPTVRTGCLLALIVWSSSRAYYFAFYVVEHYVDGRYRFAGLVDFAMWLWRRWRQRP